MSNISDNIQETIEQQISNKLNSKVAMLVAIIATFMALCDVKNGNLVQEMSQAQAHCIDAWGYFQAKSTKQAIYENSLEILKGQNNSNDSAMIKKYELEIQRYEDEKAVIKIQAEKLQQKYDALNMFDDQYDMTEALLTIAIAMLGITSLTQKQWLFYFASSIGSIGIVLGTAAFMNINLHSEVISNILG